MKDQARFKASFEIAEAILEREPERGQKTGKTKVRLGEGSSSSCRLGRKS
jgi:hypothetical protein